MHSLLSSLIDSYHGRDITGIDATHQDSLLLFRTIFIRSDVMLAARLLSSALMQDAGLTTHSLSFSLVAAFIYGGSFSLLPNTACEKVLAGKFHLGLMGDPAYNLRVRRAMNIHLSSAFDSDVTANQ